MSNIEAFLKRMEEARFTGEVRIRFTDGLPDVVKLEHYIARDRLSEPVPEVEKQFELKP